APRDRERWHELRGLTELSALREHASKDCFHFWDSKAFREHQWQTKGDLQREFLVRPLWGLGQSLQELQRCGEVRDRLRISGPLHRLPPGTAKVVHRLRRIPTATVMMR